MNVIKNIALIVITIVALIIAFNFKLMLMLGGNLGIALSGLCLIYRMLYFPVRLFCYLPQFLLHHLSCLYLSAPAQSHYIYYDIPCFLQICYLLLPVKLLNTNIPRCRCRLFRALPAGILCCRIP